MHSKEWVAAYQKAYRKKHKKKLDAQSKLRRDAHKEEKKEYDAKRYGENPEKAKTRSGKWGKENPERLKKSKAEYYQKNQEKLKAKASAYYENNKRKCKRAMKVYRRSHPELDVVKHAKRRARKMKAGGEFTKKEWLCLCKKYDYRCLRCSKRKPLAADHVVPVSKGGTSNIRNIQPLCKKCNSIKYTKTIDYRKGA